MGTTVVENWPGTPSILGPRLMLDIQQHAVLAGTRLQEATITDIMTTKRPFILTTSQGDQVHAVALILAMGTTPRRLGCAGEDRYWGRGISTCAVCDATLYRDKRVLIIGGGDTAMEEALFLTKFTSTITIVQIHNKLTASAIMQERVLQHPAIAIRYRTSVTAFQGNEHHITHAICTNLDTGKSEELAIDGAFLAIGLTPNSTIVQNKLECDSQGYILTQETTATSVPGIFAAGDVVDKRYRQAITAAGDGCRAALDAQRFLEEHAIF